MSNPQPKKAPPGEKPRPWHETPTSIMFRSMLVPGWGQMKNHRPVKAAAAVVVEGLSAVRLVQTWQDVNEKQEQRDEAIRQGNEELAAFYDAQYNQAYNERATAGWILGLAVLVSMVDAYVDAHLIQFDADFGPDPKLPGGDELGAAGSDARLRLSVAVPFTGP